MNAFFEGAVIYCSFYEVKWSNCSFYEVKVKILIIMGNCKQTQVAYVEFARQTIFLEKGYSTIMWGGNQVTVTKCLFSCSFFLLIIFIYVEYTHTAVWIWKLGTSEPIIFILLYWSTMHSREKCYLMKVWILCWALLLVFYFY